MDERPEPTRGEITRLLEAHRNGDRAALNALFPLVYAEVRRMAHAQRAGNATGTLNTTALVHEAYLKLAHAPGAGWENRAHFFAVAAKAMRQVIVDHARKHLTQKRGAGARRVDLDTDAGELAVSARAEEILDVDAALGRLAALSERLGRVVEMRFFCGLSNEEIAGTLGVTSRTIKRDWRKARAFLYRELRGTDATGGAPA